MYKQFIYRIFFYLCLVYLFSSCQIWQNIKYRLFSNREKTQITSFSSQEIDQILKSANGYRGTPYRTGGSDLKGMDCSGLIFRIYQDQGFLIPRIANEQANFGLPVPLDQLKKGDWIFFATGNTKIINHSGIVSSVKNGLNVHFIHSSTSKGVREDQLLNKYWLNKVVKAIRPYKN